MPLRETIGFSMSRTNTSKTASPPGCPDLDDLEHVRILSRPLSICRSASSHVMSCAELFALAGDVSALAGDVSTLAGDVSAMVSMTSLILCVQAARKSQLHMYMSMYVRVYICTLNIVHACKSCLMHNICSLYVSMNAHISVRVCIYCC